MRRKKKGRGGRVEEWRKVEMGERRMSEELETRDERKGERRKTHKEGTREERKGERGRKIRRKSEGIERMEV